MVLEIFSIYDSASKTYMPPMYFRSRGEAIRSFQMAVEKPDSMFSQFPDQFRLFHVGSWDDSACTFAPVPPESVIGAHEFGSTSRPLPPGASTRKIARSTGSSKLV